MAKKKKKNKRAQMVDYLMANKNTSTDDIYLLDEYFTTNKINVEKAMIEAESKIINILENRQRKKINIVLFENPTATGRPRFLKNIVHVFGAKESKERFRDNSKALISELNQLINTTINIKIDFHMEMPKGLKPWEVIAYQCRVLEVAATPDIDNLNKYYDDMMNAVVYLDDDLICKAELTKFYNLRPRVEIELSYLTKHESIYVYNKIRNRTIVKELIESGYLSLDFLS